MIGGNGYTEYVAGRRAMLKDFVEAWLRCTEPWAKSSVQNAWRHAQDALMDMHTISDARKFNLATLRLGGTTSERVQ